VTETIFRHKFSSAPEDRQDGHEKPCSPPFLEGLNHLIKGEVFMTEDRITQAEMIKKIADGTGIAQKYVKEVLESTVALVRSEFLAGRQVKVTNLGTFRTHTRAAPNLQRPADRQARQEAGHHHRQVQGHRGSQEGLQRIVGKGLLIKGRGCPRPLICI
jgi:nucleoid DNA-binding protein